MRKIFPYWDKILHLEFKKKRKKEIPYFRYKVVTRLRMEKKLYLQFKYLNS